MIPRATAKIGRKVQKATKITRAEQPRGPGAEPVRVTHAALAGRSPGERVREPSDDEEDRHDLEHPGEDVRPGVDLEEVLTGELPVVIAQDRHRPVPKDDDEDRGHPKQVGVPVPRRGRRGGELLHAQPARAGRRPPDHCRSVRLPNAGWKPSGFPGTRPGERRLTASPEAPGRRPRGTRRSLAGPSPEPTALPRPRRRAGSPEEASGTDGPASRARPGTRAPRREGPAGVPGRAPPRAAVRAFARRDRATSAGTEPGS